jgi:hypothetical protein
MTLFKEIGYSLSKLVEDIDLGEIGLPELQRPFVWPNVKVRDLFDSMYKGFPVGYLLFWANGYSDNHRQIGSGQKQKIPRLLIVDGQQRLTSLYAVIKGVPVKRENFQEEHIVIAFRPSDQRFEVADAAIRRDPEFIPDISALWSKENPRYLFVKIFLEKLRESRDVSEKEEAVLNEAIDCLYDLQGYPFTALELSSTVTEENVSEVFVRVNSKGTTLNQSDFILTLMSVFWDEGRSELEKFCQDSRMPSASAASPFNHYIEPDPDQLLRVSVGLGFRRARLKIVYSILRGKNLETEEFSDEKREEQFEILKTAQAQVLNLQNWHDFLKTIRRAGYISQSMISSQNALLYAYVFYLIGKQQYHVDHYILRNTIARWFFAISLTGRYTGSFEALMEQDLARIREITDADGFVSLLNHIIDDSLTEDYWNITLPNELATSSPRSPSLFAYFASLVLLESRVLFSELEVSALLDPSIKAKKSGTERHHLFPKGYLAKKGISEIRDTNQIANYALVEWDDNIEISDDPPSKYFSKYASRFPKEELDKMLYWHALPPDWVNMEYGEFLDQRRKMIAQVIRKGFAKLKVKNITGVSAG